MKYQILALFCSLSIYACNNGNELQGVTNKKKITTEEINMADSVPPTLEELSSTTSQNNDSNTNDVINIIAKAKITIESENNNSTEIKTENVEQNNYNVVVIDEIEKTAVPATYSPAINPIITTPAPVKTNPPPPPPVVVKTNPPPLPPVVVKTNPPPQPPPPPPPPVVVKTNPPPPPPVVVKTNPPPQPPPPAPVVVKTNPPPPPPINYGKIWDSCAHTPTLTGNAVSGLNFYNLIVSYNIGLSYPATFTFTTSNVSRPNVGLIDEFNNVIKNAGIYYTPKLRPIGNNLYEQTVYAGTFNVSNHVDTFNYWKLADNVGGYLYDAESTHTTVGFLVTPVQSSTLKYLVLADFNNFNNPTQKKIYCKQWSGGVVPTNTVPPPMAKSFSYTSVTQNSVAYIVTTGYPGTSTTGIATFVVDKSAFSKTFGAYAEKLSAIKYLNKQAASIYPSAYSATEINKLFIKEDTPKNGDYYPTFNLYQFTAHNFIDSLGNYELADNGVSYALIDDKTQTVIFRYSVSAKGFPAVIYDIFVYGSVNNLATLNSIIKQR